MTRGRRVRRAVWRQRRSSSALLALVLGLANGSVAADDAGRQLYETKGCYQCHGYVGQGGAAGPRLAPAPIPLAAFRAIVRKPPNVMPAYSPNVLSDGDLDAIYRFIASLE